MQKFHHDRKYLWDGQSQVVVWRKYFVGNSIDEVFHFHSFIHVGKQMFGFLSLCEHFHLLVELVKEKKTSNKTAKYLRFLKTNLFPHVIALNMFYAWETFLVRKNTPVINKNSKNNWTFKYFHCFSFLLKFHWSFRFSFVIVVDLF